MCTWLKDLFTDPRFWTLFTFLLSLALILAGAIHGVVIAEETSVLRDAAADVLGGDNGTQAGHEILDNIITQHDGIYNTGWNDTALVDDTGLVNPLEQVQTAITDAQGLSYGLLAGGAFTSLAGALFSGRTVGENASNSLGCLFVAALFAIGMIITCGMLVTDPTSPTLLFFGRYLLPIGTVICVGASFWYMGKSGYKGEFSQLGGGGGGGTAYYRGYTSETHPMQVPCGSKIERNKGWGITDIHEGNGDDADAYEDNLESSPQDPGKANVSSNEPSSMTEPDPEPDPANTEKPDRRRLSCTPPLQKLANTLGIKVDEL